MSSAVGFEIPVRLTRFGGLGRLWSLGTREKDFLIFSSPGSLVENRRKFNNFIGISLDFHERSRMAEISEKLFRKMQGSITCLAPSDSRFQCV